MRSNRYYAVYGLDGFGVYNDWDLARIDVTKLMFGNAKRFISFRQAYEYAVERHNTMNMHEGSSKPLVRADKYINMNVLIIWRPLYRLIDNGT